MQKLVSVIIISYQIFTYIYEALDSVLCQSYEAIELIVSDDGSDYFPSEQIAQYIRTNQRGNIRNVQIYHAGTNQGTVKNINHAIHMAHGEYIGLLAADDAYYDETVVEKFAAGFEAADVSCYLEMAQTAMCDRTLKRIDGYALFQNVREAACKGGRELFELLAYCECLPTVSFFYKKEFFERFGALDEDFCLIEDYPTHLRAVREGYQIHYENFAAVRHRSGGISRGNAGHLTKAAYFYLLDILKIREKYVKPYYDRMTSQAAQDVRDKAWTEEKWAKSQILLYQKDETLQRAYVQEYKWSLWKEWLLSSWQKLLHLAANTFGMGIFSLVFLYGMRLYKTDLWSDAVTFAYSFAWGLSVLGAVFGLIGLAGKMTSQIEIFPGEITRF